MADPFVAEIRMFAGNFAPYGWASCDGQILPISQNTALFSLLGTNYGGDGKSTFALPNFQGATPLCSGTSTTGSNYFVGQQSGVQSVTLIQTEIPLHTHSVQGNFNAGDVFTPSPTVALTNSSPGNAYISGTQALVPMNPQAISVRGNSLPHNNLMPTLCVYFIIALQGIFPPRG